MLLWGSPPYSTPRGYLEARRCTIMESMNNTPHKIIVESSSLQWCIPFEEHCNGVIINLPKKKSYYLMFSFLELELSSTPLVFLPRRSVCLISCPFVLLSITFRSSFWPLLLPLLFESVRSCDLFPIAHHALLVFFSLLYLPNDLFN